MILCGILFEFEFAYIFEALMQNSCFGFTCILMETTDMYLFFNLIFLKIPGSLKTSTHKIIPFTHSCSCSFVRFKCEMLSTHRCHNVDGCTDLRNNLSTIEKLKTTISRTQGDSSKIFILFACQ